VRELENGGYTEELLDMGFSEICGTLSTISCITLPK
jgi:hypothetical protein